MALVAGSTTPTSAVVAVTPPAGTTAATFDKFVLSICPAPTTTGCPTQDCLPSSISDCSVTGLTSGQAYNVYVEAVKGTVKSVRGGPASFNARYP